MAQGFQFFFLFRLHQIDDDEKTICSLAILTLDEGKKPHTHTLIAESHSNNLVHVVFDPSPFESSQNTF